MIHIIYIYFIINSFMAGFFYNEDSGKDYRFILFFLFGILIPLWAVVEWFDRKLELTSLYMLYFTNFFQKEEHKEALKTLDKYYNEKNSYKKWVLRQIFKKCNYKRKYDENNEI